MTDQLQQTFCKTSECSATAVVLLLIISHAAFGSVSSTSFAQIHRISAIRIVVVGQNAGHTALAEVLSCDQAKQYK